jgi:hypothetical protein
MPADLQIELLCWAGDDRTRGTKVTVWSSPGPIALIKCGSFLASISDPSAAAQALPAKWLKPNSSTAARQNKRREERRKGVLRQNEIGKVQVGRGEALQNDFEFGSCGIPIGVAQDHCVRPVLQPVDAIGR